MMTSSAMEVPVGQEDKMSYKIFHFPLPRDRGVSILLE